MRAARLLPASPCISLHLLASPCISRRYKRRDVFTGLPLPDEAEAPLGTLISSVLRELHDLGSAGSSKRAEVSRVMLARRVDARTKERMWGGFGGGWGGGGGGAVTFGGAWSGGGWGGGGGGWGGYQRMEEMAQETETQSANELEECSDWKMLSTWQPPARPWPAAVVSWSFRPVAMRLPIVSDHSCEERALHAVEACKRVPWVPGLGYNASCPVSLCDFEEGDTVVRLPGGHLLDDGSYAQLLAIARKERKPPIDPFTRAAIPPSTSVEQMRHFASAPLEALGLARFVERVPRATLGHAAVSAAPGFDVSAHPDARSKVAREMQQRLA